MAESDFVVVATLKRGEAAKPAQGTLHIEKVLLYVLRLEKYAVKAGEPVWATLEVRTALPELQTDCWVRLSGDTLELGGPARLVLSNPEELQGKVREAAKGKRILITPDKPFRVRIDLRKYFDLKPETYYHLLFGQGPQRRSRWAVFRISK